MSNVPGMIDYWAQKSNCCRRAHIRTIGGDDVEHIVHKDCDDNQIEHYGMEAREHTWPNQVDGTDNTVDELPEVSQPTAVTIVRSTRCVNEQVQERINRMPDWL